MSKDKNPQCPFIQRFAEDLKLARKSDRTVQSYCRALRRLSEHLGHDPRAGDQGSSPLVFWLLVSARRATNLCR